MGRRGGGGGGQGRWGRRGGQGQGRGRVGLAGWQAGWPGARDVWGAFAPPLLWAARPGLSEGRSVDRSPPARPPSANNCINSWWSRDAAPRREREFLQWPGEGAEGSRFPGGRHPAAGPGGLSGREGEGGEGPGRRLSCWRASGPRDRGTEARREGGRRRAGGLGV